MSHFAYTAGRNGTAASWPNGSTVTPDEFAWFASCAFKSINGDEGGTWSPSSVITIGGSGVAFTTVETTFYGITVTGHTVLNTVGATGDVGITGALSVSGNVSFSGGTSGSHRTFTVGQYVDTTLYGTIAISGTATLSSDLTLSGTGTRAITVGADYASTFNGSVYLFGTNTFRGFNVPSTYLVTVDSEARFNGGIRQPIQTITASGAITVGTRYVISNIAAGGYVQLPSGHPTNAVMKIINRSTLSVEVRNQAGTRLFDIQDATASDKWVEVYYDGASWQRLLDNGIIP